MKVSQRIVECGIIPVVRAASPDRAVEICREIVAGGIDVLEITMTVPAAVEVIAQMRRELPQALIGAGTVLDARHCERSIEAGAEFIVSPGFHPAVVKTASDRGVLMVPGALTPTEVVHAWQSGCGFVKIFPCSGPAYLKTLRAALPEVRMIPTGGVSLSNVAEYFRAGAVAVGVGSELTSAKDIREAARQFALSPVR